MSVLKKEIAKLKQEKTALTARIVELEDAPSGGSAWGAITGTLSDQTDLQTALNAKQATLVSATNIKTINSTTLLGSGDIAISSHTQNTDTGLGTLGTKNPPIDADLAIYRDSTASNALVTSTWTQIKAFLKTYFDTLYSALGHTHNYLPLAGGIMTGNFGSSQELIVTEADVNWSQEYYIEIDASADVASFILGDGYAGAEVRIKCINIDNGASIVEGATIDGVSGYTFASAGECLYLRWSTNSSEWKIISKYVP